MLFLAAKYKKGPVRANEIAKEQDISQKYLENLLATLKAAGLVTAERGSKGGYSLSRPPSQITLYDVLLPLGDVAGIIHCSSNRGNCDRFIEWVTGKVWEELEHATKSILKKKTLSGLLKKKR